MKYLRNRIILLACWLILFFGIEQISSIDISMVAYILVLAMVVIILITPRLAKVPFWAVLAVPGIALLIFKAISGEFAKGIIIPLTVLEEVGVIVTFLLAYWVNNAMYDFEDAVEKITIGRHDKLIDSEALGQGFVYREVRRARNHQRSLALLAVAVDEKSLKPNFNRMVQDVQHAMMKQFMLAEVSKMLCDQLDDCSIIIQDKDHFLIAIPEAKPEELSFIKDRLRKKAADNIGVNLMIGAATLPKDDLTFEGLVDKATEEMEASPTLQPLPDLQRLHAEK